MSPFLDCFEIFQLTVFPFDPPSLLAKRSFQENVKPFALWTDLSPSKFTIKHGSSFHKSSTPLQFEDQQNYGLIWIKIVQFIYHIPIDLFGFKIEYQWGIRNSKTPSKTLPYFFHNHYIIFVSPLSICIDDTHFGAFSHHILCITYHTTCIFRKIGNFGSSKIGWIGKYV